MGNTFSKFNKEMKILMLGLEGAGKTTILYKLKSDQFVDAIPTVNFNVETITFKHAKLCIWDLSVRPLYRHYYAGAKGVVFVIDSSNRERLEEARQELDRIAIDRELSNVPILILANKQDVPNVMKPEEIQQRLELLHGPVGKHKWTVQPSSAITGEGIPDGISWLITFIRQ